MERSEKVFIAGVDITQDAREWEERWPDRAFPLDMQFKYALEKAKTIEELQSLKKYLLEHQEELKDVQPSVMESSGDNIKDMESCIDRIIYNRKYHPGVMIVY